MPLCRGVTGWRAPVCPEAGGGGGARLGRLRSRGRRCEVETELCAWLVVYRGPGQPWAVRSRASTVRLSGH